MFLFTEPEKITNQPKGFGPVSGNETTKYQCTSLLSLNGMTKAFACQDAMMIVLPGDDPVLVNIVLKPLAGLRISFPAPSYYIYRSVLKSSFISGAAIKPKTDVDSSDFIKRLWANHELMKAVFGAAVPDPLPAAFGYSETIAAGVTAEDLFNGTVPDALPVKVKEGEWMGNFNATCGFEIITGSNDWKPDMAYLRPAEYVMDVSALPAATPTDLFSLRCARERILSYVDPAAFWGMYYEKGLTIYMETEPGKKKNISKGDIYLRVIVYYLTKNRVYLDIRSEHGYSYNFYQNFADNTAGGSNIKFKTDKDQVFLNDIYARTWPLFFSEGGLELNSFSNLIIQLRIDDNIKPLLFFEKDELILDKNGPRFLDEKKLLPETTPGWTQDIVLRFANIKTGADPTVYISNYLKLQYLRQTDNSASPSTVIKNSNYYDKIFGGIAELPTGPVTSVKYHHDEKRHLISSSTFSYLAETGAFYNDEYVLFYAKCGYTQRNSKSLFPAIVSSVKDPPLIDNPAFPKDIIFNKWKITTNTDGEINIIEIAGYNENKKATPKENIFFLGLTRAELNSLSSLAGFSDKHARYFSFAPIFGPLLDINGLPYNTFHLHVRGLKPDGTELVQPPAGDNLTVYASDNNMYCSAAFTALANQLTLGMPDPVRIHPLHNGYFFYDKAMAGGILHNSGIVTVNDDGNNGFNSAGKKTFDVNLNGNVFYPADADNAATVSTSKPSYPLVVIVHGNGQNYKDYVDLQRHLANNGFISVSIDCRYIFTKFTLKAINNPAFPYMAKVNNPLTVLLDPQDDLYVINSDGTAVPSTYKKNIDYAVAADHSVITFTNPRYYDGMGGLGRAKLIYEHLKVIEAKFGAAADLHNLALFGHSRGGEAVLMSTKMNPQPAKYIVKAITSLAPTDQYKNSNLTSNIPYFVLYGSRDGDVAGIPEPYITDYTTTPPTADPAHIRTGGFSLWDRAENQSMKTMAFVERATHNGFITDNHDYEEIYKDPDNAAFFKDIPNINDFLVSLETQRFICQGYVNAFFRMIVNNEQGWKGMFTGEWQPPSVKTKENHGIYCQFRNEFSQRISLDDFETDDTVILTTKPPKADKGQLRVYLPDASQAGKPFDSSLDPYSPHDTKAIRIKWSANNKIGFTVPAAMKDVSAFTYISFRLAQTAFVQNQGSVNTLLISLNGAQGQPVDKDAIIPKPDERPPAAMNSGIDTYASKSAMMTVRIPLSVFAGAGVNLSNITDLAFLFPGYGQGIIDIDSIEFTK